ncbi:MAG TPA: hypothetical protein VMD25_00495 [Acidobacteriaceae bacterium]|nr:hypothetical protein [Acidobacteriaceae bacterium]
MIMPTHNPENHGNLDPKSHLGDQSVREGYELTDASTGGIMVFLVGLFISVGVFFVLCFVMGRVINEGMAREDGPTTKWKAPNQVATTMAIRSNPQLEQEQLAKLAQQFPNPRVQIDNGDSDLMALHQREDLLLNYYSWVDESKGTVRIPIERAMELIAQRGLPVAPQEQQQALMTGDSTPTVQMPLTNGFAPTGYEQQVANDQMTSEKEQ